MNPKKKTTPKNCANCGEMFAQRYNERPSNFNQRQYCGHTCSMLAYSARTAVIHPDKFCADPACGKLLVRREDEQRQNFAKRVACNPVCGRRAAVVKKASATPVVMDEGPPFPGIDGEDSADFSAYNAKVKPHFGKLPTVVSHSYASSSASWAVGGSEQ